MFIRVYLGFGSRVKGSSQGCGALLGSECLDGLGLMSKAVQHFFDLGSQKQCETGSIEFCHGKPVLEPSSSFRTSS